MKKEYTTPQAEKMEFNYTESVTASGGGCNWYITHTQVPEGCVVQLVKSWHPDTTH